MGIVWGVGCGELDQLKTDARIVNELIAGTPGLALADALIW
jgi:hypothetical protein